MKHAGTAALDRLEPLLEQLRNQPSLREKSRGVFYRAGRAFLHFHEDGAALYADLRIGADFERFPVTRTADLAAFRAALAGALGDGMQARSRSTSGRAGG